MGCNNSKLIKQVIDTDEKNGINDTNDTNDISSAYVNGVKINNCGFTT